MFDSSGDDSDDDKDKNNDKNNKNNEQNNNQNNNTKKNTVLDSEVYKYAIRLNNELKRLELESIEAEKFFQEKRLSKTRDALENIMIQQKNGTLPKNASTGIKAAIEAKDK
jgi:hypothetical protein